MINIILIILSNKISVCYIGYRRLTHLKHGLGPSGNRLALAGYSSCAESLQNDNTVKPLIYGH